MEALVEGIRQKSKSFENLQYQLLSVRSLTQTDSSDSQPYAHVFKAIALDIPS